MQRPWNLCAWFLTLALIGALGCAGVLDKGGSSAARDSNTEIVLVSFGSVHGEILECG